MSTMLLAAASLHAQDFIARDLILVDRNSSFTATFQINPALTANRIFTIPDAGGTLLTSTNISASAWLLDGNATSSAYNGTTGSFLGTSSTQPLVLATTNTSTPQPIQFWTNNTLRMTLDAANGNLGLGAPTPGEKLEVADGNILLSNTGTSGEIRIAEPSAGGSDYSAFKAQSQAASITYTLPDTQGSANTVLTNDGSGLLSWATNGATVINNINSTNTGGGAFSGNQDDLAIDPSATFFRVETTVGAGIDITGIAGGADGRQLIICNVGANSITLKNQDAGSSVGNRFELPGASDVTLGQNGIVMLIYDATSGYWRFITSN